MSTNTHDKPRLIGGAELTEKGIKYSRQHLHRLIRAGKFPKPVKIGENRNAWIEAEVDAYIADRIAERDAAVDRKAAA